MRDMRGLDAYHLAAITSEARLLIHRVELAVVHLVSTLVIFCADDVRVDSRHEIL